MKDIKFIEDTVSKLNQSEFESLKKMLVGEYISYSFICEDAITKSILAEKLCDYFEKLELKTGMNFDKLIDSYIKNIDSIVGKRVAKTPQAKKNDPTPIVVPRARKYYERALYNKNSRNISVRNLLDYSRIMFCLYTAIIKNGGKEISNFDYSIGCLSPECIIDSMKNEQYTIVKMKKNKFDIKDLYCLDTGTFILSIIILYAILHDRVEGEYYHE